MMLLYLFLPVTARLASVGDEEVVEVLLGEEDEGETGAVGVNKNDVVGVVVDDDSVAPVVVLIPDVMVELLDA